MPKDVDPANAGTPTANAVENPELDNSNPGQAESSAQRILEESKKWKQRASLAEKELNDLKKREAETAGQFKQLYEAEKIKNENISKSFVRSQVRSAVDELARKSGCANLDALMKLGNPELLEFNEDSGKVYGADVFIDDAKKSHPYLFQANTKTPTINPATPGGHVQAKKLTAQEIVKLPLAEQKKYWLAAAQKTAK